MKKAELSTSKTIFQIKNEEQIFRVYYEIFMKIRGRESPRHPLKIVTIPRKFQGITPTYSNAMIPESPRHPIKIVTAFIQKPRYPVRISGNGHEFL